MLMSTLAASGLFAGISIMPILTGSNLSEPPRLQVPIILVQATGSKTAAVDSHESDGTEFAPFPEQAQFETGDTWISGLQACLRGTPVTISSGVVRDCGELNLIMVQALIRDARPVCTTIKDIDQNNAVVGCQTTTGKRRYDLATYMIAEGWGFAAVDTTGHLIVPGYRVAEESARSARAGLWAYSDMPHPVAILAGQGSAQR
jgi:endonuclease YncB( thermonuclease family)